MPINFIIHFPLEKMDLDVFLISSEFWLNNI